MDALDRTTDRSAATRPIRLTGAGLAGLMAGVCIAAQVCWMHAQAQVSVGGRAKNFVAPVTDAQGRKSVVRGREARPAGRGLFEINGMQAETYRGQQKDMVVEAPQCVFDSRSNVASSPRSLSIRTADERFSLEGEGFRWQLGDARLNSKLVISNRVHSLVRKRLITAKPGLGAAQTTVRNPVAANSQPAAMPASAGETNEFIDIRSDQFEYESDRAVYRGQVRVRDTEGDLTCGVLTVIFRGENGALQRIEAGENVALSQGDTRAKADEAVYVVGQDNETVEFLGHAVWEAGGRQGSGQRVIYDRRNRTLRAEQNASLKLPRSVLAGSGFLWTSPGPAAGGVTNMPTGFVEVFSDLMTIQLPPTNGPVRQIVAEKNVLIADPEQGGRALADHAVYQEATGVLELTGAPILEAQHRLVNGQTLRFDRATRVFSAGPDAYVKIPLQSVANLGLLPPSPGAVPAPRAGTNQFIEVWAKDFEYSTNLLQFRGNARANFLEGTAAVGKLTCDTMTIRYAERVQSLLAEKNVDVEQFAAPAAPRKAARKMHCERLRATFTPEGRLEMAVAEQGVTAEQEESRPGHPQPVISALACDSMTAFFSATNRLERMVAEKDVVFTQDKRTARGDKAVYADATGLLELTGHPTASMPEGKITAAERLVWDRLHARFMGMGKFKSEWKRPPGGTNQAARPWLGATQEQR
jgi:lipopolysaccharide export system protein LptA